MKTEQLIKSAYRSLMSHAGRSFLTMLGIIIGIASIIAILAIGKGAENQIQMQIAAMSDNFIAITSSTSVNKTKLRILQQKSRSKLKTTDAPLLKKNIPLIDAISPYIAEKGSISYRTSTAEVIIKGGNEELFTILNRPIESGSFLQKDHNIRHSRSIVLGNTAAHDLGCSIDNYIKLNGIPFHVIGILKPINSYIGSEDPNFNVFIPLSTLKKHIQKRSGRGVHALVLHTSQSENIPLVIEQATEILRLRHHLQSSEPNDFRITTQESIAKTAAQTSSTFNLFLFLIGLISLIVGGIGIMNIMLVAVSERQREIGIRLALGATEQNIRRQFLIEAIVLCSVGGIIGILIGLLIALGTKAILGWPISVTLTSILCSTGITLLIGIFFGFYPAYLASKLNPVDALCER
ncbi:ABC transporter permease [Candidatus Babeliales bacterium]|nr:ABC transporter permease [Candidatus Babeliales bacterium]